MSASGKGMSSAQTPGETTSAESNSSAPAAKDVATGDTLSHGVASTDAIAAKGTASTPTLAALDQDLEVALREFVAQSPPPIARQLAQYPWSPQAIETQKTRLSSQPPPVPPDAIGEHLKTVAFTTSPAVAVAIEGGIAAAQQLNALQRRAAELETTLKRMIRDIRALKDHLLQLEPHAQKAPRIKALIATSLRTCDLALAAAGER